MSPRQLPEAELAVLEVLWACESASTREITEAVYGEVSASKMASVQKLVERLENKDCVERDRSQRAHKFLAAVSRDEVVAEKAQALADQLCDGKLAPLVSTLLRSAELSATERKKLRQLIDELWPE